MRRDVAVVMVTLLGLSWPAPAAPGDLDPSFSSDGWVRFIDVQGHLVDGAEDVAVQPDGRIVAVASEEGELGTFNFAVVRLTLDGELDTSFGQGGIAIVDRGSFETPYALALQPDGGIVVAGQGVCDLRECFLLARLLPDGRLDAAFGQGGMVGTVFPGGSVARDVAVAPDGKIVAVGYRRKYGDSLDELRFAVARYRPDGSLDRSFSRDGRVSIDFGYGNDFANAVAVRRDGGIVAVGEGTRSVYRTKSDVAVAWLRSNGSVTRTVTTDLGSRREDSALGVAARGSGAVVVGSAGHRDGRRLAVLRYGSAGRLDASFGKRLLKLGGRGGRGEDVLVQGDGRIVVVGAALGGSDISDFVVVRLTQSGRRDRSFSGDGVVVTDFGTGVDHIAGVARDGAGRIVVAGWIYGTLAVARYLA